MNRLQKLGTNNKHSSMHIVQVRMYYVGLLRQ